MSAPMTPAEIANWYDTDGHQYKNIPGPDDPPPAAPAVDADEAWEREQRFHRQVWARKEDLRVNDAARRLLRIEQAAVVVEPVLQDLTGFLAVEDPDTTYRVDRLWPVGGRVLFAAQYKAGKTTARDNLIRSLADGDPFLGEFPVTRPDGAVVVIDNELDERMLRRWLRRQGVHDTGRVHVLPLRGRVATFNLLDPDVRGRWADRLAKVDAAVVLLDCLRPLLDAFALKESTEAGQFLVAFDALLTEAGAGEGVVIHHMGHTGERSRGDSRLRDWPDVEWKLVRQVADEETGESEPDAPRYFSAYGRDVDVGEGLVTYDGDTRALTYAGGTRRQHAADDAIPTLVEYVRENEGKSQNEIVAAFKISGVLGRNKVRQALARAVELGHLDAVEGPRKSYLYCIPVKGGTA